MPDMTDRWRRIRLIWGLRAIPLIVTFAIWWYAAGPGDVSPLLVPKIGAVTVQLLDLVTTRSFWSDIELTLFEIIFASAVAITAGFAIGFWASRRRVRSGATETLLAWGYLAPLVVFYPLFILWFGIGIWSKIAYATVSGALPIAYNTVRGFRSIDPKFTRVGIAFGASPLQLDWNVKLGAALPMVLAGIRIGVAAVVITVILAEMLSADRGIGYELSQSSQLLEVARSYALIIVLLVMVGVLQQVINRVTRGRGGSS
jgi:ABC-type nitrate/sulfonate/bicarbonate transport system permease component